MKKRSQSELDSFRNIAHGLKLGYNGLRIHVVAACFVAISSVLYGEALTGQAPGLVFIVSFLSLSGCCLDGIGRIDCVASLKMQSRATLALNFSLACTLGSMALAAFNFVSILIPDETWQWKQLIPYWFPLLQLPLSYLGAAGFLIYLRVLAQHLGEQNLDTNFKLAFVANGCLILFSIAASMTPYLEQPLLGKYTNFSLGCAAACLFVPYRRIFLTLIRVTESRAADHDSDQEIIVVDVD